MNCQYWEGSSNEIMLSLRRFRQLAGQEVEGWHVFSVVGDFRQAASDGATPHARLEVISLIWGIRTPGASVYVRELGAGKSHRETLVTSEVALGLVLADLFTATGRYVIRYALPSSCQGEEEVCSSNGFVLDVDGDVLQFIVPEADAGRVRSLLGKHAERVGDSGSLR